MFLLDWFYGVLASLGLWQKEANILFLGSPNARKTTLLHMLKDERLVQDQPAQYLPIAEEFRIGKIKFKAFDFGGPRITCRVLQDYHVRLDRPDGALENHILQDLGWLLGRYISYWENEAPPRIKSGKVFECDIERQMGYRDGFEWLSQYIE